MHISTYGLNKQETKKKLTGLHNIYNVSSQSV